MTIRESVLNKINQVAAKYSKWQEPSAMRSFYKELEAMGVTVGMIHNRRDNGNGAWHGSCEYYINGEEVEDSRFVMAVYEGDYSTTRNEYTLYFS